MKSNVFKDIYNYRELLKSNVRKEIRGKYKGSILGILWSFINPLLTVLVYVIVFPYLMGNVVDNYLIYLITGIIPWTFFTTVIGMGITTVRANAGIIKKVYFPREILPISIAISSLINFLISCIIVVLFTVFTGVGVSWHIIFLPIIALIQTMFSLAIIFPLSALNIYLKDIEYVVTFALNMVFYATPIIWSFQQFAGAPAILIQILKLNPMTVLITMYRDIFLYHQMPSLSGILIALTLSIILLVIGYKIFNKLEKGFAEEI